MPSPAPTAAQAVLIGAGHAHLHIVNQAHRLTQRGVGVTLIDPDVFWYSGLATGVLGGMYEPREDRVDPAQLAQRRGATFVRDRVVGLDRAGRQVRLACGGTLRYDALSLNVGSEVITAPLPGAEKHGWPVKPISNLASLRHELEERMRAGEGHRLRLLVIGGGATGCEIAANLAVLAERHAVRPRITLLSRSPTLLSGHAEGAQRAMMDALRERRVEVMVNCPAQRLEPRTLVTEDGRRLGADAIIVATGLRPPRFVSEWQLPVDDTGGVRVKATLQAVDDERVFAVGDCISFEGRPLPKLGVFGVREAPVLLHNLAAVLSGGRLRDYRPQERYLAILNLGRDEGLALWGPLWWRGRASLWVKDRIDRRFLDRYRG